MLTPADLENLSNILKRANIHVSNLPGNQAVTQSTVPWIVSGDVNIRRGTFTDRSGSIASGGVAQTLAPANNSRSYILIQNNGTADLWFDFTTTAIVGSPSFRLQPGADWSTDSQFVTTESISIISSTTGASWTAKEG